MAVNSISSGSPHARPMGRTCGRTCGEPDEIKKNTRPKNIPALCRDDARLVLHADGQLGAVVPDPNLERELDAEAEAREADADVVLVHGVDDEAVAEVAELLRLADHLGRAPPSRHTGSPSAHYSASVLPQFTVQNGYPTRWREYHVIFIGKTVCGKEARALGGSPGQ